MELFKLLLVAVVYGGMLTYMAVDDWRSNTVSGVGCLISWCVVAAGVILVPTYVAVYIALVLLAVLFYLPVDIPMFGDADIIPVAMITHVTAGVMAIHLTTVYYCLYLLVLLLLLFPYAKYWAKKHGTEWHFGSGTMVPALPCFAAAWWVALAVGLLLWAMNIRYL